MTLEEKHKCHAIIHTACIASSVIGFGLAQIPLADSVPLCGIQTVMITSLAKVFDVSLSKGVIQGLLKSQLASQIGVQATRQLIGEVPIAGNVIKGVTASALTEAIGWAVANDFSKMWGRINEKNFTYFKFIRY